MLSQKRRLPRLLGLLALCLLPGLWFACNKSVTTGGERPAQGGDGGGAKAPRLPELPVETHPCGAFGVCIDQNSSACGPKRQMTQRACSAEGGRPGICCTYPDSCGLGGLCISSAPSQCPENYTLAPSSTQPCMLPNTKAQGQCCLRQESANCAQLTTNKMMNMTAQLLPTGLERIAFTLETKALPPTTFLEDPLLDIKPPHWKLEGIQRTADQPQRVQFTVVIDGTAVNQVATIVVSAFVKLSGSGVDKELGRCTIYQIFKVSLNGRGTFDIESP